MSRIRIALSLVLLGAALAAAPASWSAPLVYRGSLTDRGEPAQGNYGFRLTFYGAEFGGVPLAPATTLESVAVSDGAFSADLALDPVLRARETLWLQVEVRDATGRFVPLAEREALQPKAIAAGVCWDTQGNAGTLGTDFLGTTDNQGLSLRVNGQRAMRFEPTAGAPNILGGASVVTYAGVEGGTIAGGSGHRVSERYATVGGGLANYAGDALGTTVDAEAATVAGGTGNRATALAATVGGGSQNMAPGRYATVAGGNLNVASGDTSVVSGGIGNQAAGTASTVAGGVFNVATGIDSAVPGGHDNCAGGTYSLAAGNRAIARAAAGSTTCAGAPTAPDADGDEGTFVWGDSTAIDYVSTGPNQFLVRATGGVAVNTTPPNAAYEMTVKGTLPAGGNADLALYSFGAANDGMQITATTGGAGTNDGELIIAQSNGSAYVERLRIGANGDLSITGANAIKPGGGTWTAPSDRRIKQDVASIAGAIDTLLQLRPVSYRYNDAYRAQQGGLADTRHLGFIAQEFGEVFPDAVSDSGHALPGAMKSPDGSAAGTVLALDSSPALITTVAAAQELAVQAEAHAGRIARLESDNAALRARLDRLERLLARAARAAD